MEADLDFLLFYRCVLFRRICQIEARVSISTGLWPAWSPDSAQTLLPGSPKATWPLDVLQGSLAGACPLPLEASGSTVALFPAL